MRPVLSMYIGSTVGLMIVLLIFFSGRAIVNHGCRRPLACEEHDRYKEGVARDDLVQAKPLTLSSRGPLCAPQQYVPSADSATS